MTAYPEAGPRVLLWSPRGAGEHYHGPGSFAYRLYGLAAGRARVELAHASDAQERYDVFAATHRIAPPPTSAVALARYLRSARSWLRAHRDRFDVLHGLNGYHYTVLPAHHAESLGLPAVLFVTGHRIEFVTKPGLRGLVGLARTRRRLVRGLSAVVAMSRAIHEELLTIGVEPSRIARIPMGVDTVRFRPAQSLAERSELRAALGIEDAPTLAFVGGLTIRKRPHLAVTALSILRTAGLPAQLVLVGPEVEPDYAVKLRALARDVGVDRHVHHLGHVAHVERVLRACDLFVLPSSMEGMSAALVEAMSTGLPPLVTAISGSEDLVAHGENGFHVEPTPESIATHARLYLTDDRLAQEHGLRSRRIVERGYSAHAVLDAHLRLFRAVRHGGTPADVAPATASAGPPA